jgi:MYXO-CTERM domain-containing protein
VSTRRFLAPSLSLLLSGAAGAANPFANARIDANPDGSVRLAEFVVPTATMGATPEEAARAFVRSASGELGIGPDVELARVAVHTTYFGASVRFEQRHNGVPVIGADLVVTVTQNNRVRLVASGMQRISRYVGDRRIDPRTAIARAAENIDGVLMHDGSPAGSTRDVFYVSGGVAHLAYEVRLAHFNVLQNIHAIVDAATGERLSLHNRVFHSTDDALIWNPSPGRNCDQPLMPTQVPDLISPPDPNGYLVGNKLVTSNCCYHASCDPTQPPARAQGTFALMGRQIQFDTVVCDRAQTATNSDNCRNNYVYPWEPEPSSANPPGTDPADEDEFAEVNAYVQTELAYQWFRTNADPNFDLRGNKLTPPQPPLIWVNLLFPDLSGINPLGSAFKIDNFVRVDNAAFIPGTTWAQLAPFLGSQAPTVDTLVFFQGTEADFAYDASVIYHEFGHAVVVSTANFDIANAKVDSQSAADEAGVLSEAFADYFSSAMRQDPVLGEFVVPRMSNASQGTFNSLIALPPDIGPRNLSGNDSCPALLDGEIHNDSQSFSEALWAARESFLGTDTGMTFDKAVYAGLVSMSSSAGISDAVTALTASVTVAFGANASATFQAPFTAHGVLGCNKVQDLWGPKPTFDVVGTSTTMGPAPIAPGPVQLRVWAAQGVAAFTVQFDTDLASVFTGTAAAELLASINQPITFNVTAPTAITSDAQARAVFSAGGQLNTTFSAVMTKSGDADAGSTSLSVPCGGAWVNFAVVSEAAPINGSNLTATIAPDLSCTPADGGLSFDAGVVDAGAVPPPILCQTRDSGIPVVSCPPDASQMEGGDSGVADAGATKPPGGCGCTSGNESAVVALLLTMLAIARRRRSPSRSGRGRG